MAFLPAICTKCEVLILVDERNPFVECPTCIEHIVAEDSIKKLEDYCLLPSNINDIIERCLNIEKQHGPQLPVAILAILAHNFPLNEEVHYLIVRMKNFDSALVQNHLIRYKDDMKKVAFAEDFLNKALTVRNMEFVDMFQSYIENKLKKDRQVRYIELIRTLMESYTKVADSSPALGLLYGFFGICSAINISILFWFLFTAMPFWAHVLIVFGIICVEVGLLFLHNKTFGNRLKVSERERLLMVIYMSSVVIAVGAVFLGSLFSL